VYGAKHVDPNEIQTMLTPLVEHGYFATNLALIRDRLRQLSWVRDIAARRSWPELLSIVLIEKKPLAQMSGGGLLSEEGEVFFPDPKTYPENLPIFSGPAGKQVLMLEHYKNINRIITPLHAKIIYIELTSYEEWIVSLDNGITLHLGQHDILTRLMHFVNVYHKIIGDHAQDVDYVDLRYSNGVAVKRKMSV
jgi:cell division protein FtsQ